MNLHDETPRIKSKPTSTIGDYIYYHPAIGKGSYSRVYSGYHQESKLSVAVKKISKQSIQLVSKDKIDNEIELMKGLNNQNIVKYIDMIIDKNCIYIITEYCNGGNLQTFINNHKGYPENFCEQEVRLYMTQVKNAMRYLISKKIYHRDIKPHNIFINYKSNVAPSDIELKIGDFGFAKTVNTDDMGNTLCGTPMYLAPEIVYNKKHHINSDLWSIGIILFQLLYGDFPFGKPKNIIELMKNIDTTMLCFPRINENPRLSDNVHSLLTGLLQRDPTKRICWGDFFSHPWFTEELLSTIVILENNELIIDKIDIVEDYCDRFITSMPINIPGKQYKTSSYKTSSYSVGTPYSNVPKNLYNYISSSIGNLRKYVKN